MLSGEIATSKLSGKYSAAAESCVCGGESYESYIYSFCFVLVVKVKHFKRKSSGSWNWVRNKLCIIRMLFWTAPIFLTQVNIYAIKPYFVLCSPTACHTGFQYFTLQHIFAFRIHYAHITNTTQWLNLNKSVSVLLDQIQLAD